MGYNKLIIQRQPILPIEQSQKNITKRNETQNTKSFAEILRTTLDEGELKFSKHAIERIESRNIKIAESELTKIKDAVDRAALKGVKDSLVLMDDLALVISVKNRVVVTAVDGPNIKQNIFTNIDGAVII
jgi:flagellar operon protein